VVAQTEAGVPADLELAERASQLTQRVQALTRTRSDAVDTAVAELRRIERDLHDGAQRPFITEKAVSKHAAGIFGKLELAPSDDDDRRVLAVLAYLDS
jgi:hypothetical protein